MIGQYVTDFNQKFLGFYVIISCNGTYIISRFICMVEDVESLQNGRESLICLESMVIFPAFHQYIHESLLYVSAQAMIFNKFYHPTAAKIHGDQDLENISLSGNLHSAVLMNPKAYHGKPSLVLCGTIP